jgi:DNA-binding winged helix-turn-helix (wHTH) protein
VDKQSDKLRFDGWTLHKITGELTRGDVSTRLEIRPLHALLELIEHRGEVVSREQLYARLWPKGVVDFDSSLNTAIGKVRAALKDNSDKPRYIETIPRRGYRFLASVEVDTHEPAAVAAQTKKDDGALPAKQGVARGTSRCPCVCWRLVPRCYTCASPRQVRRRRSRYFLVVVESDHDTAPLALGITEELSSRLAQLNTIAWWRGRQRHSNSQARRCARDWPDSRRDASGRRLDRARPRCDSVTVQSRQHGYGLRSHSESFNFKPEDHLDIEKTLAQAWTVLRIRLSPERAAGKPAIRAATWLSTTTCVRDTTDTCTRPTVTTRPRRFTSWPSNRIHNLRSLMSASPKPGSPA